MNPFTKKIPRGVIYHSVGQSLRYLLKSLLLPLDDREKVAQLERAFASYCGRKHCVAFPFARTAIHFSLKNLKLPPGSEILMPPITIKGIVDAVVDLGLLPVYVDSDPETACFQMEDLKAKLGPQVKAALITTLFGLVPDLDAMVKLLKERGIFVIEDFSQCLNGRFGGRRVDAFGDVGIYSSSSIKTMDTLGGGLAVTDDEGIARGLREAQQGLAPPTRKFLVQKAWTNLVRNLATSQPFFSLLTFPFLQVIRWLSPESALKQTGHRNKQRVAKLPALWFRRYTSVQAAIGLENMPWVSKGDEIRVANVEFIKRESGVKAFPRTTPTSGNVYWQLILPVPDARQAQAFFATQGIDTATSSLELVSALKDYPNRADLPKAGELYRNGIFIPCFPNLTRNEMRRIASALKKYFQEHIDVRQS